MIITAEDGFTKEHAIALRKLTIDHSINCIKPNADLQFYLQHHASFHHVHSRNEIRSTLFTMKRMILEFAQEAHPEEKFIASLNANDFRLNAEYLFDFQRRKDVRKRATPCFFFAKSGLLRLYAKKYIGLITGLPDDIFVLLKKIEDLHPNRYEEFSTVRKLKG